jgi:hypothetical protein
MKRVGIFLMIVVLVVGMTGCGEYTIAISSGTGGTVTDPGEGSFRYPPGTVVNLVAEPDRGYRFVCWSTNAGTIADIYDATTTVTLNRNYYFVIANFGD